MARVCLRPYTPLGSSKSPSSSQTSATSARFSANIFFWVSQPLRPLVHLSFGLLCFAARPEGAPPLHPIFFL